MAPSVPLLGRTKAACPDAAAIMDPERNAVIISRSFRKKNVIVLVLFLLVLFSFRFNGQLEVSWNATRNEPRSFFTVNDELCLNVRGNRGHWYINETMARETFYRFEFRSNKWARMNQGNKFAVYPGTQYAWREISIDNNESDCQIRPVNRRSFCSTMYKLRIGRILLVGDSLMGSQLVSLVSLIGYPAGDFVKVTRKSIIKRNAIECPQYNLSIPIHFYRENLGPNLRKTNVTGRTDAKETQQFGPEIPYCVDGGDGGNTVMVGEFCPWHAVYNATGAKTLLVTNQGAHFHSVETFAMSMDLFVELFNKIAHPGDILVFRSTVPGHRNCWNEFNETSIPVTEMTHDRFLRRYFTTKYDWNLFNEYNAYAKRALEKIVPSVTTHYLNVYNMTVLRPDQHVSSKDCLHYTHPGPVDFWNHLLFTNLADMTRVSSRS